ncbi:MAG TPA: exopolysaccharide biosynthesis protein [Chryseobacterium sp.]|nr:exopolysaccharide biosynthesis protein [Chryseobacterium sp.]
MAFPKVKILVCTHKKALCLTDDIYMPIQVGRVEVDYDLGFQTDLTGDNIGDKHFTYSEYTGIYWAWKNLKNVDYIGWCHYRRYFCLNNGKEYNRETLIIKEDDLFKFDFSTNSLKSYLSEYDIILPIKRVFPSSVWDVMKRCHDNRDLKITEEILQNMYPEYMPTFNKYLKNTNRLEQLSVFITKWEIFDNYCKWLFSILFEIEKRADILNNSIHTERKIAFIAEQLSSVYYHHNKLKIKHLPVAWVNPNAKNKSWFRYHASNIKSTFRYWFNV